MVVVRDTLAALGDLAAFHRRRQRARVLAVAGSNGKTTTKEMAAAILRRASRAGRRAPHPRNAEQSRRPAAHAAAPGDPPTRVAVLELGMNGPGRGVAAGRDRRARRRGDHVRGTRASRGRGLAARGRRGRGGAVPPAAAVGDGGRERRRSPGGCRRDRFPGPRAALRRREPRCAPTRSSIAGSTAARSVCASGRRVDTGAAPVAGRHNVGNALAATALTSLGGSRPDRRAGRPGDASSAPSMRMQVERLASGVTVINDAYNANPASMAAALQTLAASAAARRLRGAGRDARARRRDRGGARRARAGRRRRRARRCCCVIGHATPAWCGEAASRPGLAADRDHRRADHAEAARAPAGGVPRRRSGAAEGVARRGARVGAAPSRAGEGAA